jgi:hypothetical protein
MYVIREIQVCLCVCMCMHACMHMHIYTHIHTCVYVCMYVHGPDAGVPEQARFSGMHACMHVRTYAYVCIYAHRHSSVPARRTRVIDTAALVSGRFLDD